MPKLNDPPAKRKERLAINLFDLDPLPDELRKSFFDLKGGGSKLDLEAGVVRVGQKDEVGVIFGCDLLTAAGTVDMLNSHMRKVGEPQVRVYLHRGTPEAKWTLLPESAVLTKLVGDEPGCAVLSEEWFPKPIVLPPVSQLAPKPSDKPLLLGVEDD